MQLTKRFFAILLTLALALGNLPWSAMATGWTETESTVATPTALEGTVSTEPPAPNQDLTSSETVIQTPATNATIVDSGSCGSNVSWTLDNTGTLTISGTGAMSNYTDYSHAPWYSYEDIVKTVVVEPGVTTIGNYAFDSCDSLTSITIGNNVTTIGYAAFYNCCGLTSITIPDSVTTIGDFAFCDCDSLTSVTIGDNVTIIGSYAFCDCDSLTSVTIPDSVTTIGNSAFFDCDSLSFNIFDNAIYLGNAQNPYHALIRVTATSISSCQIHEDTWLIADSAFEGCSSLTSITIPDGVTTIGYSAFYNCCFLADVRLGEGVTTIRDYAFYYCTSLTSITIPNSVTTIGSYAFYDCSSLTSITIPDSVTTIGSNAFYNCASLTDVYITDLAAWLNLSFGAFTANPLRINYNSKNLYLNGELLTNAVIPEGVETIRDYAFYYCTSLTSITIPNSVTTIGEGAFYDCSSLTSITIPDSVTTIGSYAFSDCDGLTSITIPDSVTSIGEYAFSWCDGLTEVYITDLTAWLNLPCDNYSANLLRANDKNKNLYLNGELLTNAVIPEGVETIRDYAFYYCSSLTSITIPATVTSISENAFSHSLTIRCYIDSTAAAYAVQNGCPVSYLDTPQSISVVSLPNKLVYSVGGELDLSGLCLSVQYNAEISETFSDGFTVSDYDFSTPGTKVITVSVNGCSATFEVSVDENYAELPESAHPYADNCNQTWNYTHYADVKYLQVTFSADTATESGYDFIYICDENGNQVGRYSGTTLAGVTLLLPGRSFSVKLTSDGSSTGYGFRIASVVGSDVLRGTCGDGLTWTLDDAGTLTISGAGAMDDYLRTYSDGAETRQPWEDYQYMITRIVVEEGITSIGSGAFADCSKLTSVSLPNTLTYIDDYVFSGCTSLPEIVIPDGVTAIGDYAFDGCYRLTDVVLGNSVESIGEYAFQYCESLMSINFPASIQRFGWGVFDECYNLIDVYITDPNAWCNVYVEEDWNHPMDYADRLHILDENGKEVTELVLDSGLDEIPAYAFKGCVALTSVVIPDSVTAIDSYAFRYCTSLTSVTIGDSVTTIGDRAFSDCTSLTSVTIGNSVTTIGSSAFSYCDSLTSITIPDSVTTIGNDAFFDCDSLTSITIPDSVTTIDRYAFCDCTSLTSVTIGDSVTTIGSYAFEYCTSLTSITIPSSVRVIRESAFSGTALTDVYYSGTESQWNGITIAGSNNALTSANIHYRHIHDYSVIDPLTVAPTCTESGYTVHTCVYGDTQTQILPALGHAKGAVIKVVDPTCAVDGYTLYACANCGEELQDLFVPALGHEPQGDPQIVPPTCAQEGYTETACARCSETIKSDFVEKLYHTMIRVPGVAATCEEDGVTNGTVCENCGMVGVAQTVIPALGHDYADGVCQSCGDVQPAVIGIAIKTQPTKTHYWVGQSLDTTGLTLTVAYADGSAQTITDGFTVTGFDATTPGNQALIITYIGCTTTYTVTVVAPQLVVESKEVASGTTFTVAVYLKNNPGIGYLEMTPVIPAGFTVVKVENGNLISDLTKGKQYVWVAESDVTEDGLLMTFTFSIDETVGIGTYPVSFIVRFCSNYQEETYQPAVIPGNIEIVDFVYGDVNGDGTLNGMDVLRLTGYFANMDYETGESAVTIFPGADANGDGQINGMDILRLKRYFADLDYETGESTVVLGPQQ